MTEQRDFLAPLVGAKGPGRFLTHLRYVGRAMAVLAVPALLAAGCGGGAPAGNKASPPTDAQVLKYVQCLQQHGVNAQSNNGKITISSNGGQGDGSSQSGQGNPGSRSVQQDPQEQAAMNACKQYAPNGGKSNGQPSAQELDRAARFAQCMTQHGVPTQAQGGNIQSQASDPTKMQQAQQACQHLRGGS